MLKTPEARAIASCLQCGIKHRVAFSSRSFSGVVAVVRQGLAMTALARCAAPRDLRIVHEGAMPALPSLTLALIAAHAPPRQPVATLTRLIRQHLS